MSDDLSVCMLSNHANRVQFFGPCVLLIVLLFVFCSRKLPPSVANAPESWSSLGGLMWALQFAFQ